MSTWSGEMVDTVTVAPQSGSRDQYAEYSTGTQREVPCRIEYDAVDVRDSDGNIIDSKTLIISQEAIGRDEFIWLPGTNTSNDEEAVTPSKRSKTNDLAGGDTVWEVVV